MLSSPFPNNIAKKATNAVAVAGIIPSSATPAPVTSFNVNHANAAPVPIRPNATKILLGSLAGCRGGFLS